MKKLQFKMPRTSILVSGNLATIARDEYILVFPLLQYSTLKFSWRGEQAMCALRGMGDGRMKTWDGLSRPLAYEKNYYQRITKKRLWRGGVCRVIGISRFLSVLQLL